MKKVLKIMFKIIKWYLKLDILFYAICGVGTYARECFRNPIYKNLNMTDQVCQFALDSLSWIKWQ